MEKICVADFRKKITKAKPYLLTVGLQFGLAGAYIFIMASLNQGMNRFVFIVYRHAVAAIALAPFALIFERKIRPKMTISVFLQIMALAFLDEFSKEISGILTFVLVFWSTISKCCAILFIFRPVIDQGFAFLGMQYTSASFASALTNVIPSVTFVLAVIFRIESVNIKEIRSVAKVIGTLVTFAGALLMTLYKGPIIHLFYSPHTIHHQAGSHSPQSLKHWLSGTLFLLLGCVAWSSFFILQSITLKRYPAEMSLSCLICLAGALQTSVVALVAERHSGTGVWAIGWDFRLFGPLYTGIITSGITYYVQGLVLQSKGPVFLTAFNPLCMIITSALGSFLFAEHLHLGSIIGAIIIALGLYSVVWGKGKDYSETTPPSVTIKQTETQELPNTSPEV